MTNLNPLNDRLAVFGLPLLTEAKLNTLPVSLARIEHALGQAERGRPGAQVFLINNLRNAVSAPSASTRPAPTPPAASSPATARPASTAPAASSPATARPAPTPPADSSPATARPAPTSPAASSPATARPAPTPPAASSPATARPAPTAPAASSPATARPALAADAPEPVASASRRVSEGWAQCRIYGGKAALCVETDDTRQNEPTLRLEAALATAPNIFDWKQKIAIQLTADELPRVVATVLGLLPRCECKNHGPNNDKGLEIAHQGQHLFIRVFQKNQTVRALPVGPSDSYYLAALGLRQLRKAAPWLSDQGVLAALKLTVQRMAGGESHINKNNTDRE